MNLPLFYRSVVPLDRETHREFGLAAMPSYAFAAASHLIPAVVDEFPAACAALPIVFTLDATGASPVFLAGLTPGRNAYVRADGSWAAAYVPAYLRRYPFILGEVPNAEPLICLDDKADTLDKDSGEGRVPLFTSDGGDTDWLVERIRLVTEYTTAAKRTQAMSKVLADLKLLQPITVQNTTDGASSAIHGLLAVSEPALTALSDADFLRLRADGTLAAIYTHLVSLRAIERMPR